MPGVTQQSEPLYEQVAGRLTDLIEKSALRPGDRLPSVRKASRQHRVSLTTVVQAYLTLENRGLVEGRPRSGFYVRYPARLNLSEPETSRPGQRDGASADSRTVVATV